MPKLTIEQAFQIAVQHHQASQLQQAENLYRQILAKQPNHSGTLHHLGLIAHQKRHNDVAVELIRRAISLDANNAEAHNNLGAALREIGQWHEALAAFRRAIAIKPDYAQAHSNLGTALADGGQLDEAIAAYRQAILLKPDHAEAQSNLGTVLQEKGELDQAVAAYRRAITLRPEYVNAYYNLSIALKEKGELHEAMAASQRAIVLNPNYAEAYCELGIIAWLTGNLDVAIANCRRAISLRPNYAQAYGNLGNALRDTGQIDEAVLAYRQAIVLNPNLAQAYSGLGGLLADRGQLDEAITSYRQALSLGPSYISAHSNLLLTLHYHPAYDGAAIVEEHRRWDHQHAEPLRKLLWPCSNDRCSDRRLRIGYVSSDFRDHCLSYFTIPLLSHHNHEAFEIFCYADILRPDNFTDKIKGLADAWHSIIGMSDQRVADLVRNDRIDVLVDLTMHTARGRLLLFARKPAPVQVAWMAYPGTTGLATIDYRLTDPFLDPPGLHDEYYVEKSIRLPDTFWCYQPMNDEVEIGPLPVLSNGLITFGCLNNFCKVNEQVIELWAKVMNAVSDSRMILLTPAGEARLRISNLFERFGVSSRRVEFVPRQSWQHYIQTYHRIDIGLDTLPYNGHVTSIDSFWMGVPVITKVGKTVVGRAGLSLLSNLKLTDLVAENDDQFVSIAAQLAGDRSRLSMLRATLRSRMAASPLMDARKFAQNVEAAYRSMWRTWCESPPAVS